MTEILKYNLPQHNLFKDSRFENGQYYVLKPTSTKNEIFIRTQSQKILETNEGKFLIDSNNSIINSETGIKIAQIYISNWKHIFNIKNSIQVGEEKFLFKQVSPLIKYNIFKKETWNNYSFLLFCDTRETRYNIKIERDNYNFNPITVYDKLKIEVENRNMNSWLILAGLLLIEDYFENSGIST